ncbi:MAG: hypothetical protein U0793_20940 [Gemmataceae bacterium]
MPLFERPPRRRPGYDLGACAVHPEIEAYGKCRACGKLMCNLCRTRWYDQAVCPTCLTAMLEGTEANPRDQKIQSGHATWSVIGAFAAWLMVLCAIIPFMVAYSKDAASPLRVFAALLFFGSLVPAAFAIGQAVSLVRRGPDRAKLAATTITFAGLEIGLVLGMLTLNLFW